jgi:peroxiredoxin
MSAAFKAMFVVASLSIAGCSSAPSPDEMIGTRAPDVRLTTLDRSRFYLADHLGSPVALLFWDTMCGVCKEEMVRLDRLTRRLRETGLVTVNVCTDPENLDAARRFVSRLDIRGPVALDRGRVVAERYRVSASPTTVLIGPDGRVALWRRGYTEQLIPQLEEVVVRLARAAR